MSMERATDELAAANGALAHLGETRLSSLTEDRPVARVIADEFGNVRDALLRRHNWNFARRWATPARDPNAPSGSFPFGFPLPADVVRVQSVEGLDDDQWTVEAPVTPASAPPLHSVLYAAAETVRMCYTASIAHVRLWDPLFLEVFKLELAAAVAPVLGQASAADNLRANARAKMGEAKRADARENARSTISRDISFLAVRR